MPACLSLHSALCGVGGALVQNQLYPTFTIGKVLDIFNLVLFLKCY